MTAADWEQLLGWFFKSFIAGYTSGFLLRVLYRIGYIIR